MLELTVGSEPTDAGDGLFAQQVQAQSQFQNMRLALPAPNDDKGDDSTNSGENPAHGGMYL